MSKFIVDFYLTQLPKGSEIFEYQLHYIDDGHKRKRHRIKINYKYKGKRLTTTLAFSKKLLNNEAHKGWMKCQTVKQQ